MPTLTSTETESLSDFLNSATSPEDLQAVEQLMEEATAKNQKQKSPPIQSERPKSNDRWTVTRLADVAEFMGLSIQTVKQWRTEPNPMPGTPGSFNLADVVKWYRARQAATGGSSGIGDELKAVEMRLKTSKAEAQELENAKTRGELVQLADVERWAATILIELRESFMSIPDILATSSPQDSKEFVREESERVIVGALTSAAKRLSEPDYQENYPNE
jgi:phage terminase Nu1 subunit (DNA packaging protein)